MVEEVRDEDSRVRGGRVGSRIVDEALRRGHEVTAVVRDPSRFGADRAGLRVVAGDVTDAESVAAAVAGHDAVVNAVAPTGGQSPEMFSEAAHALLDGLPRAGVRRLVVVGGGGSLEVSPGVRLIDTPAFEEFPEEWKPGVLAQAEALEVYRGADVDWTYLSPPGHLEPGERTGSYRAGGDQLLTDDEGNSAISMEDYAIALLDEIETPRHVRRRFTVAY